MHAPLVILTGASGVGKTTLALAVEETHPEITVFRFDTVGVPTAEVMASYGTGYQPGGAWQRSVTLQWLERIAPLLASGTPVLFEGQMRIAFIQEGVLQYGISTARVILIECDDNIRDSRLIHDRKQPELANDSMRGWSRYLHQEAVEAGCTILNTAGMPLVEGTTRILEAFRRDTL